MNDEAPIIIIFCVVLMLACIGGVHLALDYRNFNTIVQQCEKQGYIQNDTVRITCVKERKND